MLVFLPIVLLAFDVAYKWWIYKKPPHDSVADIALAGLTFNAVHVMTRLVHPDGAQGMNPWVFVWVTLQFGIWPLCLFWSAKLQQQPRLGWMFTSYLFGAIWFTYSTGRVLTLLP